MSNAPEVLITVFRHPIGVEWVVGVVRSERTDDSGQKTEVRGQEDLSLRASLGGRGSISCGQSTEGRFGGCRFAIRTERSEEVS